MTQHAFDPDLLPPRLSMNEYVEFLATSFRECDLRLAQRQKQFEERISKPFRMSDDAPDIERGKPASA